jgi:hypothetical protein
MQHFITKFTKEITKTAVEFCCQRRNSKVIFSVDNLQLSVFAIRIGEKHILIYKSWLIGSNTNDERSAWYGARSYDVQV